MPGRRLWPKTVSKNRDTLFLFPDAETACYLSEEIAGPREKKKHPKPMARDANFAAALRRARWAAKLGRTGDPLRETWPEDKDTRTTSSHHLPNRGGNSKIQDGNCMFLYGGW